MEQYLVCSGRPWGKYVFNKYIKNLPGDWHFLSPDKLINGIKDALYYMNINPKYIFFIHWSEKVPKDITDTYECIAFHPSSLPHGRGGSPIQNLIKDGYKNTELTAFRMTDNVDAGPIYIREALSLDGTAEEIYLNMSLLAADMIEEIIRYTVDPVEQEGFIVQYKRRKPHESEITRHELSCTLAPDLRDMFDHIRMLDAEGYPRAYLEYEGFRFTFSRPTLKTGKIVCDVEITESE